MVEEELQETKQENVNETQEDEALEGDARLPFANAQVVRVMRQKLASDKMIKSEVKKAMNEWLAKVCMSVSARMNDNPYAMIDMRMFKEAVEPYENLSKVREEKIRIVAHLNAIQADCDKLKRDVEETFIVDAE